MIPGLVADTGLSGAGPAPRPHRLAIRCPLSPGLSPLTRQRTPAGLHRGPAFRPAPDLHESDAPPLRKVDLRRAIPVRERSSPRSVRIRGARSHFSRVECRRIAASYCAPQRVSQACASFSVVRRGMSSTSIQVGGRPFAAPESGQVRRQDLMSWCMVISFHVPQDRGDLSGRQPVQVQVNLAGRLNGRMAGLYAGATWPCVAFWHAPTAQISRRNADLGLAPCRQRLPRAFGAWPPCRRQGGGKLAYRMFV